MAKKQGGKGKSSSPSSIAYWSREKNTREKRKARRIAQHAARMGITVNALTASGAFSSDGGPKTRRPGDRQRENSPRLGPIPMASLKELPANTLSTGFVRVAGKILEASPDSARLHDAFSRARAVPREILRRDPLGRLIPVETVTR